MQAIKLSPNQVSCPHSLCSPEHQTATRGWDLAPPHGTGRRRIVGSRNHGLNQQQEIISIFSAAVWREIILEEPNELALQELYELMRRSGNTLRKRCWFSKKCSAFIGSFLLWMFKDTLFFFLLQFISWVIEEQKQLQTVPISFFLLAFSFSLSEMLKLRHFHPPFPFLPLQDQNN